MGMPRRTARYRDIEGTPFEIFSVPGKPKQSLVVIEPATHPFGYLLDHARRAFPEEVWAGSLPPESLGRLPQMDDDDVRWAEAWGWWALDVFERAKREGTLPADGEGTGTGAKNIRF